MSRKFLPLAGIAVLLAIVCYIALSFLFPHKKAEVVETAVTADAVFSESLNEANAQPTASTSAQSDLSEPAIAEASPTGEAPTETAADGSATEVPLEVLSEAPPEAGSEVAAETPSEPAATETAAESVSEPAPAETAAAVEPSQAPEAELVEAAPAEAAPAQAVSTGLSREQLARIVAEAAAKAAAETAKSIAEQAARDAAGR